MKTLWVRYEVSETAVAENERLVREVFQLNVSFKLLRAFDNSK